MLADILLPLLCLVEADHDKWGRNAAFQDSLNADP